MLSLLPKEKADISIFAWPEEFINPFILSFICLSIYFLSGFQVTQNGTQLISKHWILQGLVCLYTTRDPKKKTEIILLIKTFMSTFWNF